MLLSSPGLLARVLSSYQLGPKLRQSRLRKKMGLKDLGTHAGDSGYFDFSEPHSYRGLTEAFARAVVITLLPQI